MRVLRTLFRRFPPALGAPARAAILDDDDPKVAAYAVEAKRELEADLSDPSMAQTAETRSADATASWTSAGKIWSQNRPSPIRALQRNLPRR